MKIEDCEVGMKVRNCWHEDITKGDEKGIISNIEDDYINFEDRGDVEFYPEYFEPIDGPTNKFEVGDEVIWHNHKVKIWGVRYDDEVNMYEYAIEDNKDNCGRTIVFEGELSPLKKADELEVGDKFIRTGTKYEVLAVAYEEFRDSIIYFAKMLNGNLEGRIVDFNSEFIDEIIYD